jgi:hypothetical protein
VWNDAADVLPLAYERERGNGDSVVDTLDRTVLLALVGIKQVHDSIVPPVNRPKWAVPDKYDLAGSFTEHSFLHLLIGLDVARGRIADMERLSASTGDSKDHVQLTKFTLGRVVQLVLVFVRCYRCVIRAG